MLKGVPVLNGLYIAGSSYVYWLPVCLDLSKQRLVKAFLSSKQDFILEIKYINIKKKNRKKKHSYGWCGLARLVAGILSGGSLNPVYSPVGDG